MKKILVINDDAYISDLLERMGGTLTASYSDGRLLLCLVFPDDEEQARSL